MSQSFCPDAFWDQSLTWEAENPDFTECFKQIVLTWVPCLFLLVFSPLDVYTRSKSRYSDIPLSFFNMSKTIVVLLLIVITIFEMVMSRMSGITKYGAQVISFWLKISAFIVVAFLQNLHKRTGNVTSALLSLFWLFLVIFAIPQFCSDLKITGFQSKYNIIYFSLIFVMLVLNCFADKPPRKSNYPKSTNPSPEKASSYLRQVFFQWFDRTIYNGWKRPLTENDIYDINPENLSKEVVPPFDKYFKESVEKGRRRQLKKQQENSAKPMSQRTNGSMVPATLKAYCMTIPFWICALLQIVMDAHTFITPLILGELITYTADPNKYLWKGLFLTFSLFFGSIFSTLVGSQYSMITYMIGYRIRTALISAIYRKSLRISSSARKDITAGEIVNLMAVDASRFSSLISYFHIIWSGLFVMAYAIWQLWNLIGIALVTGLLVSLVTVPITALIASKLRDLYKAQMEIMDERVKSMNEVLNGMKVLKLYAWEPSFEKLIMEIRGKEMFLLKKAAIFAAGTYFIWTLAPFLVTLSSFISFVLLGNKLTPTIAFVSLEFFAILRGPMAMYPNLVTYVMQTWVSVKRINNFLNAEEVDFKNVTKNPSENALSITDGTFTWGGETTTLNNINMTVKKGNLTALVGPVGCGKTSLVSVFLGEMERIQGSVNIDGRSAYVPQQAWIQNATLKDNILFGSPLDKKRYETVIEACALTHDLAMLPGGDQTEIGEKGINLSGGQKQRVSLARAVYSGADVYLFDDPLSAVDSHVGKHIFDNVFSDNGLLKGKTRLLVTHAVVYLPMVDEIYVMVNGEITESGSYKTLLSQKGAFADFLTEHIKDDDDDDEEILELKNSVQGNDMKPLLDKTLTSSVDEKSSQTRRRSSEKSEKYVSAKSKIIADEDAATGSVGFGVYIRYFKSIGWIFAITALVCTAAERGLSLYCNIWLAEWTEDDRANDPNDHTWRNLYIIVYGSLGTILAATLCITSIVFALGGLRAARDLHNKLLHNIMRLPMSFFDTTPLGRIINRFSRDVDIIDCAIIPSVRSWIVCVFAVFTTITAISYSTPIFLSVIVPMGIIYYFIQKFYVATSRQLQRIESISRSPMYSHFSESINGQSTIRAYGYEDRFTTECEKRVDNNQRMTYPSFVDTLWLSIRLEILGSFIVLFAALFAVISTDISPAIVGLSILYALQVSSVLSGLVSVTSGLETSIVSIERVDEYSNAKQEAPWKTVDMNPDWPKQGVVEFKNFQLRYREGLELVLKGINISVKSQEKVGIVGRTGAGKSSLTLSLFRIIEPAGGKITIDNIDISVIGLHSLRSRLTIIPQDPVLFCGSLRMNIDPFNHYSDDQIWNALEDAHLKPFVEALAHGLQHKIAEGGENLSVGQRQLVCLARALLRKTKVLILDEATAAIDLDTDKLIQNTIRTKFADCTILTIAHRLNTIMDSDRVIVLDKGTIVEYDSPEVLLANKDSVFYGMAKSAGLINTTREQSMEEKIEDILRDDDSKS